MDEKAKELEEGSQHYVLKAAFFLTNSYSPSLVHHAVANIKNNPSLRSQPLAEREGLFLINASNESSDRRRAVGQRYALPAPIATFITSFR